MSKQKNNHDLAFKKLMRQEVFAKAFVEQYLTPEERKLIDVSSMTLWNASFVQDEGRKGDDGDHEFHSDVVYKVKC